MEKIFLTSGDKYLIYRMMGVGGGASPVSYDLTAFL